MEKYAQWISSKSGRWIMLAAWIVLAAILNMIFPQANSQKNELADTFEVSVPSGEAEKLIEQEFSTGSGTPALLTWYRKDGLTTEDLTALQALTKEVTDNPVAHQESILPLFQLPPQALSGMVSEDGTTLIMPLTFEKNTATEEVEKGLNELKDLVKEQFSTDPYKADLNSSDLLVRVTGPAGISVDATKLFAQGDLKLLFGTVAIVLILLLVIYRSPIMALVPLVGVGVAYGVISPLLGVIGKNEWAVFDSQALSIMTVLLFGAGTDYCLFLIASYRNYLEQYQDKKMAMKKALFSSLGAIAMSGLTVVISLLVLLLAKYGAVHRFAIPFSLAILIMMIASLTLVPAILSILGRASFYPFVPKTEEMRKAAAEKKGKTYAPKQKKAGFGSKMGDLIIHRPWPVTIITVLFLGSFAFFATKMEYTFDTLSAFPDDLPSREGFAIISDHFSAGELAPVHVIVETDGVDVPLQAELSKLDYAASVNEPVPGSDTASLLKVDVTFDKNPYGNEAMAHIPELRDSVEEILTKAGIDDAEDKVWLGGITAEQYDTQTTTSRDADVIIPVIIALIAALLLFYLRSVVATLYLIATVLLSFFSALGLGWVVLHYGFGVEAIQGLIPLYSFVFIVALGEDYNIFMVSSIWKKSKSMPLKQAIKEGVVESGAVITSAGLILAATFAVLTTLPLEILFQFGVITAIGILLDTFIVRPFLVPCLTVLVGKWAFWPSKKNMAAVDVSERVVEK